MGRSVGRPAGGQVGREGGKEPWMQVLCENYNIEHGKISETD